MTLALTTLLVACAVPLAPVEEIRPAGRIGEVRPKDPPPSPDGYRIRPGDTLYAVAFRFNQDYQRIAEWNDLRPPYLLRVGQTLRLTPPAVRPSPPPKLNRSRPTPSSGGGNGAVVALSPKGSAASKGETAQMVPSKASSDFSGSRKLSWLWPAEGKLAQRFVSTDRNRQGIRIAGRLGQPVKAAESGRVVYAGSGLIGYGKLIIIMHSGDYLSAYAYNRRIFVEENAEVERGEKIGEMGGGGDGASVLHFEIRKKGAPVDPIALLPSKH